jgi:peptidoglycan glycosyltransferase
MNRPIRRVGYAVVVLMLLLVGQLTYLQVVDADRLANDPRNVRPTLRAYNRARGQIITADGQICRVGAYHRRLRTTSTH